MEQAAARGDGKTWAEKVADRCVRKRMQEAALLDERFFSGVTPAPVTSRIEGLGGVRSVVIGGFNEHSAEVHCFVERAAAAGAAAVVAEEGLAYEDVRAALRKRYRQRLATGAWRDFHTHLLARLPYINPTPAAEAKLLAQRAEHDRLWQEKRAAVHQRRLGEGEALVARAGSGRGQPAANGAYDKSGSKSTEELAAAFLEELWGASATVEAEGGGGDAAGSQAGAGVAGGRSEDVPAMGGDSESGDDEETGQGAAPQGERRQAKSTTKAEVVRGGAGEGAKGRARTGLAIGSNGPGTPETDDESGSSDRPRAGTRTTTTRGKVHKIGSLGSSGGGGATIEGAPGGGAPTNGR